MQDRAFEVGLCLYGNFGERLVRRTVARRAERSRSDFVCPGDVCKSNELSEQNEERLAAQRKRAAVKVSNECSKDREERLRAKRERAAANKLKHPAFEENLGH